MILCSTLKTKLEQFQMKYYQVSDMWLCSTLKNLISLYPPNFSFQESFFLIMVLLGSYFSLEGQKLLSEA